MTLRRSDYDIVWDGTHGDRDGDLLDTRNRVPDKITPTTERAEINLRALVRATLFAAAEPLLLIEIAHALETSTHKINGAIFGMKDEIVSHDTGQRRPWGGTLQRYALSDAARNALKNRNPDLPQNQRSRRG